MRSMDGVLLFALGLFVLGSRCKPDPVIYRPMPADAGTPADCDAACKHLRALKCPEGEPTAKGASCETVCNNTEGSGTITLSPACVAQIQTCSEVDSCTYGATP